MSQQTLDLRRPVKAVRRHKILVVILAVVGLLAGGAYGALRPPMFASTALVVLPNSAPNVPTEVVIADSDPVLSAALPQISPSISVAQLRRDVQIKSVTSYVISVTAKGKTAAEAETRANAVANSYIAYVSPKYSAVGHVLARILEQATTATSSGRVTALLIEALIGLLIGAVIGVIVAVLISHSDRRLRERDDIANSVGIPVLASVPVGRPSDAAGWTRLLDDYKPTAVDAWQLRRALQQLGMGDPILDRGGSNGVGGRFSLGVLSLSSDLKALALGPQLAVFAASQGILTTLVIGPQQDSNATAALHTACAVPPSASSRRPSLLRVMVSDDGRADLHQDTALIIVVIVVDGQEPEIPDTMRTTATVIGVSAAVTTAEQLARTAVVAAADGRDIAGIFVADPEEADRTTGRIPGPVQPVRRKLPARWEGIATEIKR